MKRKIFSWTCFSAGILLICAGLLLPLAVYSGSYIYIRALLLGENGLFACLALFGVALLITGLACILFPKTVEKNYEKSTYLASLGLSALSGLGLACFFWFSALILFDEAMRHHVEFFHSGVFGVAALAGFILLSVIYFVLKRNNLHFKAILFDAFNALIFIPAFFATFISIARAVN